MESLFVQLYFCSVIDRNAMLLLYGICFICQSSKKWQCLEVIPESQVHLIISLKDFFSRTDM